MKKLLVILVMLIAFSVNAQWEPSFRLTNASGSSSLSYNNTHNIAANGNILHTVWQDNRDGNLEIYYKRSTDGGTTWGTDTRLTNNTSVSGYPGIAVSGSLVHIIWEDLRNNNWQIYYKRSTDGGVTWGTDTRLTNITQNSNTPSIAVSGSIVHAVWHDNRDGNYEIYYKRSTDGGGSWGSDIRLSNNIESSTYASIAVFGSIVHIVWRDFRDSNFEIYYKRSQDAGLSFGAETRLTSNSGASNSPTIAVSGSVVNTLWDDSRDGTIEIYSKRSIDGGITWGVDQRLTNNTNNAYSYSPSIAVSGSNVHLVWYGNRDSNTDEIYYNRSQDGGVTWGTDTRLTNNSSVSNFPSIEVSGSILHVVYCDNAIGWKIYYLRNLTGNVGIQNISTETPSKYSLSQNYPNPFNSTSNLKFQIVNTEDVKLIVYDIMGKEVQTLVNERLQPGTYEAAFDASSLNTGVYFYKLITNGFTETKKMLMIK